jgi:hypothetical protein
VFQRLPGTLQKDPVLWIDDLCLARSKAEETRIEQFSTLEHSAASDELRIAPKRWDYAGRIEISIAECLQRVCSGADVVPEITKVPGAWKPARKTDNSDGVRRELIRK